MMWWLMSLIIKPANVDKIVKNFTRPDADKIFKEYNKLRYDRK